jgi:hypothetical protein
MGNTQIKIFTPNNGLVVGFFFGGEAVVFTRGRALWVMVIWAILGKRCSQYHIKAPMGTS